MLESGGDPEPITPADNERNINALQAIVNRLRRAELSQTAWEADEDVVTLNGKPMGGTVRRNRSPEFGRWWPAVKRELLGEAAEAAKETTMADPKPLTLEELASIRACTGSEAVLRLLGHINTQKDRLAAAEAERDALQARIARLLQALADRAILAEYDCPGDAPEICGWQCEICGALGAEPSDLDHAPTCLFAAAEAAQKGKAP